MITTIFGRRSLAQARPMAAERGRNGWVASALCLLATAVAVAVATWPVITSPLYPGGADQLGHLLRLWYLTKVVVEEHAIPNWLPLWYNGQDFSQYYPPLVYYLMLPINLLLREPVLTYRVFVFISMFLAAGLTYLAVRAYLGHLAALLAGLLYILAPYNIRTIFFAGNLPRTLSLVLIPLSFYFLLRLLRKPDRLGSLGLTLTVMSLVLAHQMQALMVLLGLCIFTLAFFIVNNEPIKKMVPVILSVLFGVWLSLWWLIPATTNFDLPTVPYLMPEKVAVYSLTLRNFDPFYSVTDAAIVYPSLALIVAAALGLTVVRNRMALCLFLTAALMLLLTFGTNLPFWWNIPFSQSLLPWRFLNVAYFPLAVLAAWGMGRIAGIKSPRLGLRLLAAAGAVAVLAAIYLDYHPRFDLIRGSDLSWLQKPVSAVAASAADDGRFAYFSGHMLSEIAYVPVLDGGRLLSEGWAFEGTIHHDTIRQMNFAYTKGFPEFLARTYALWNARKLILDDAYSSARPALEQAGWIETGKGNTFPMLSNQRPSSYLMYQDRSALAIGYTAPWVGMIYPWVATGASPYVEDYQPQFLSQFDILILTDFRYRDSTKLDQILRTLMSEGKTLVLDMTGNDGLKLFGVTPKRVRAEGPYPVSLSPEIADRLKAELSLGPFRLGDLPWIEVGYDGLTDSLASIEINSQKVPILGYSDTRQGRAYFLGLNLFVHILENRDSKAQQLLENLLDTRKPNKQLYPAPVENAVVARKNDQMKITYSLKRDSAIIVSESYSPHWQATLGGKPLPIYNFENLLMTFLPAGSGTLVLEYKPTPVQLISWLLSGVGVLIMAIALTFGWQHFLRMKEGRLADLGGRR